MKSLSLCCRKVCMRSLLLLSSLRVEPYFMLILLIYYCYLYLHLLNIIKYCSYMHKDLLREAGSSSHKPCNLHVHQLHSIPRPGLFGKHGNRNFDFWHSTFYFILFYFFRNLAFHLLITSSRNKKKKV